ncbi:hypothetical protein PG994_000219 [Apiospora phragmitis]|uniref:SAP domain-containing protein n=1 Tax=Apiospora phragmitis TaxID=2905665 RepID=A0ABR1X5N2_9PEZI
MSHFFNTFTLTNLLVFVVSKQRKPAHASQRSDPVYAETTYPGTSVRVNSDSASAMAQGLPERVEMDISEASQTMVKTLGPSKQLKCKCEQLAADIEKLKKENADLIRQHGLETSGLKKTVDTLLARSLASESRHSVGGLCCTSGHCQVSFASPKKLRARGPPFTTIAWRWRVFDGQRTESI